MFIECDRHGHNIMTCKNGKNRPQRGRMFIFNQ